MYGGKAAQFLELYPASSDAEAGAQAEIVGIESGRSSRDRPEIVLLFAPAGIVIGG